MDHWMGINPWKNQINVIYGFDFICKIEGSYFYEHATCYALFIFLYRDQIYRIHEALDEY